MQTIKVEKFEGPLDLLLQLIQAKKMPITDIALVEVTEQYSRAIAESAIPPEEIADFLVIAAKLLWLKSKSLLPELEVEAEAESVSLAEQLKVYKLYHDKISVIEAWWGNDQVAIPRSKSPVNWVAAFRPPSSLTLSDFKQTMAAVIERLVLPQRIMRQLIERTVTLQERIQHLVERLKEKIDVSFWSLVGPKASRSEIIVSFLALLELTKQCVVIPDQSNLFADIAIKPIEPSV